MQCAHGGSATVLPAKLRVKASGSPVLVATDAPLVVGCPFATPSGPMPCVAAQVTVAASRVKVSGVPVVTAASVVMTTGSGPPVPVTAVLTQTRVTAK